MTHKKLILPIIVMVCCHCIYGQPPKPKAAQVETDLQSLGNPYIDSEYLLEKMRGRDIKEIIRIINSYGGFTDDNTDSAKIAGAIRKNAFLKPLLNPMIGDIKKYLRDSTQAVKRHGLSSPPEGSKATGAVSSLFSATKVADGLGTFIAERFKEELTQRYLQAFRDSILQKGDTIYHYSVLLPQTYRALKQYENIFDYKSFITALKEAFKDDLDNMAPNSLEFVNKFYEDKKIHIDADQFYLMHYVAQFIVNDIREGRSPSYIFRNIETYPFRDKLDKDVYGFIRIASMVASNLEDNLGELGSKGINDLLRNPRRFLAFSGLMIEKERVMLDSIKIQGTDAFTLLNNLNKDVISRFIRNVEELRFATEQFVESDREFADIVKLASKTAPSLQRLLGDLHAVDPSKLNAIFIKIANVINIYEYAHEQKYGLIITETLTLLINLGLEETSFFKTFKKYGLFISNVAQAETSQEVKEALDVAALPVGSYKIKRNAYFDISLNAYPGISAGLEFRSGIPAGADVEEVNPTLGFSVPVGLAFSWGRIKEKDTSDAKHTTINQNEFQRRTNGKLITKYITGRSNSLFFSVIDIGAITSFRLINDETETLPEFSWNNILAPGLYYVNGLKDTPLSWGLGLQYGPQLRSIEQNGTQLKLADSLVSVRLFLAVDIPIFNFYTRTTPRSKD